MSKKYLNLFVLAGLSLLSLVGCQKDGQGVTLKAKISPVANGADKLYIDGFSTYWTSGDAVFVNDQSNRAVSINGDGSAIIQDVTSSSSYAAVYPSSIVNSGQSVSAGSQVNITLPATQEYSQVDGKQIVSVPMAAYTTGTTLDFANLCSVVKVDVTNSTGAAFSLNSITIAAAGAHLAGEGVLTIASNGNSNIAMSDNATSSVSLHFENPDAISSNESKSYYLVLPAFDQTTIDIVLNTTSGEYGYQKTNSLTSNVIAKLALTVETAQEPPMSGEFTINNTGGKVRFALGNLQYSTSGTHATADGNNTNGTWRFAEHQYDASASEWTSSFQWGTSGYNGRYPGATVTGAPGMAENYDWGKYNAISNGGTTVGYWRTLTKEELEYVLNSRATNYYNRRYIRTKVGNVSGVLLLPDSFTWPSGVNYPGNYFNTPASGADKLLLSVDQFQLFEQEGCAFLPDGYYWTVSQVNSGNDRYLWYTRQNSSSYSCWDRGYNCSESVYVRLVHAL